MNRTLFKIILLLCSWSFNLYAQNTITVESTVDKSTVNIGDRIYYTLQVKHSEDVKVTMPAFGINLGQFEIQDYKVNENQKIDDLIVESITYQISIYEVGDFIIPPTSVKYTTSDSLEQAIQSDQIAIHVESVKPSEAEDIKDIKPPLTVPADYTFFIWLGIVSALFLMVILSIYIYLKKFKKREIPFFAPPPPRPAHEIAYEALDKLAESEFLATGKIKEYYIIISEIIRVYLTMRYEIDVLEMTTSELIEALRRVYDIDEKNIDLIHEFLGTCDMVKFAKFIPDSETHIVTMKEARQIIDKTKRIFVESTSVNSSVNETGENVPQKLEVAE